MLHMQSARFTRRNQMKNSNGELHIKKSSSAFDALQFAKAGDHETVFVDDDQIVIATAGLGDSWQRLIDDCGRDMQRIDKTLGLRDQVGALDRRVDDAIERADK